MGFPKLYIWGKITSLCLNAISQPKGNATERTLQPTCEEANRVIKIAYIKSNTRIGLKSLPLWPADGLPEMELRFKKTALVKNLLY